MNLPVCIPQDDASAAARRESVAAQLDRYDYTWHRPEGVATANSYPREENFSPGLVSSYALVKERLAARTVKTGAAGGLGELKAAWEESSAPAGVLGIPARAFDSVRAAGAAVETRRGTPDVCASFFDGDHPPLVTRYLAEPHLRDRLHAWQRVAGANPLTLRRARAIPEDFTVTADHFARAVGEGDSLDAARAEGRLYVGDWTALDGVVAGANEGAKKHLYAPWALYVESRAGELLPAAIQCGPRPGAPVVTPADGARWEAAKLAVQCADTQLQGLHFHLGRCHFLMEAFALATMRRLAERHPVKALLRPSLRFTLAINRSVRDELLVPGANLDALMAPTFHRSVDLVADALRTFDLAAALPPADIAARDVGDLAAYPWRDDSLDVWRALRGFVVAYLRLYYPDDAAVRGDVEVAAWAAEMASPWGGRLRVPAPGDLDALADLVAYVMFVAGPQHSVINYGQYDTLAFAPHAPMALYGPLPGAGDDADAALDAMYMPAGVARKQFNFFFEQSQLHENTLGDYPPGTFLDPRVDEALRAFQRELADLEARFTERNHSRLLPFPWILPSAIRASIHS